MPDQFPPSRDRITSDFQKDFFRSFIQAIVDILRAKYRAAAEEGEARLSPGFRRKMAVGVNRWAYVDEAILRLANKYKVSGIEIVDQPGQGSVSHVEIRSRRFVLTVAYVPRSHDFVKFSKYREDLALEHQTSLFGNEVQEKAGIEYYGILIHGPMETAHGFDPFRPGFLKLAFPNRKFTGYAMEHIDLLSLYNIPLETVTKDVEQIPDKAKPKLKKPRNPSAD